MTETGTDWKPDAPREGCSRLWKWTRRVLVGVVGLVVFVLLAGVLYQFVATRIDAYRWYPPPGEMVDVGGSSMHVRCTGEEGSAPTVVMDIGAGGNLLDWGPVQPGVAKIARVCTYDRGGAGWSDPGAQPRTSQRFAEELHALLNNARVEGPYVLVGHSLGGNNVQIYASRYPDEVAGMVLVDPQFYNSPLLPRPGTSKRCSRSVPNPKLPAVDEVSRYDRRDTTALHVRGTNGRERRDQYPRQDYLRNYG